MNLNVDTDGTYFSSSKYFQKSRLFLCRINSYMAMIKWGFITGPQKSLLRISLGNSLVIRFHVFLLVLEEHSQPKTKNIQGF